MTDTRRVIVTGATGLIGHALCELLQQRGYSLVIFSRSPAAAQAKIPGALAYSAWQPEQSGPWSKHVDGAYAVIHLAGGSIFSGRQTKASIQTETQSRIVATEGLVQAMSTAQLRPEVFISASSVGTYGYAGFSDAEQTEDSPAGKDFWGQDSLRWEAAALDANQLGVRTVVARTGYVLADQPGSGLAQQAEQFRRGFGGLVLPGSQWTPWVHIADVANLLLFALEHAEIAGPLNVVAPGVVRNREFATTLGKVLGKPARMPTPGFLLRLGLGVTADTIIHGRRVVPRKALDSGYAFQFPALEPALHNLLAHRLAAQNSLR